MLNWLKNAVFYEIYPISFFDSNGDGKGDLKGIIDKVDYIKSLGVDAVWFNPFFKSPFKDGGYDISDYYEIDKRFGTMSDFDELVKVFKKNDIKIVLDLVIGHTSNQHKWFKKSSSAKRNKYSDYYVWTENNFQSYPKMIYGLSYRDGGYLPNYYASQPALNYGFNRIDEGATWQIPYDDDRLKPLRDDILDIMRFYLDKGIDGFRVDMAASLVKNGVVFDENNPFDDSDEGLEGIKWFWNKIFTTLKKEYKDKVYIAEWCVPQKSISKCGFDMDFMTHDTLAFNELYRNKKGRNLSSYYERGNEYFSPEGNGSLDNFIEYSQYLYNRLGDKGCFCAPTGTHDEIRMPTGKSDELVKTIFAFMLTLKQVPMIYYGDEIGIEHNFNVSKDGGAIRTGARTPMQWTDKKGRGFSSGKNAYLPVSDKKSCSVEYQEKDKNSLLNTVRKLIEIRKKYKPLYADADQKFISSGYPCHFERSKDGQTISILINPSDNEFEKDINYSEVIYSANCIIEKNSINMKKQSFAILLK